MLKEAGIPFTVLVKHIEETYPAQLAVYDIPAYIAKNKAGAVDAELVEKAIIVAADTIVICNNEVLGKPKDEDEAKSFLRKLSGRVHDVITGVCIRLGNEEIIFSDTTKVFFRDVSEQQICHYVEKYKPLDKAGAYAIQEWIGMIGISKIEGDYYNVMGLPVNRVVDALSKFMQTV